MQRGPAVCIFGATGIVLVSDAAVALHETVFLDCRCFETDADLDAVLAAWRPQVIVSFGPVARFARLWAAPFEVRRRWLHFEDTGDLAAAGRAAFDCYIAVCLKPRAEAALVSVFTPTHRTGGRLQRAYGSLCRQSHANWEWVVLDDSDDEGRTYGEVCALAALDQRIRPYRRDRHSGCIGEVKYEAAMLTTGSLLVELDHDDALTPEALALIAAAGERHPACGMFYSDFAEVDGDRRPLRYGDGWAYGFGRYREEIHDDEALWVAVAPNVNPKTIRALVSCPNHVRAWRRGHYLEIGGHNRQLWIADDFDLVIRSFLATRIARIPALCYVQYHDGTNTQAARNADIQRHVRYLRDWYDAAIHRRFEALGVEDWVWDAGRGRSDLDRANPADEQAVSVTVAG